MLTFESGRNLLQAMIAFFLVLVNSLTSDCAAVLDLASGVGMKTQQPARYTSLTNGCCDIGGDGIDCDGNGRVFNIGWNNLNLNGFINQNCFGLFN